MDSMLFSNDPILSKLKLSNLTNPKIVFADLDGTLFAPNWEIVKAPFYNFRIQKLLKKTSIPFIIVTGRSDWANLDKKQIRLLGLPYPDGVITANGTIIYRRAPNNTYIRDMHWESLMHYNKVTWEKEGIKTWNKLDITSGLKECLKGLNIPFTLGRGNTFLIRIKVISTPVKSLAEIKKKVLEMFPNGVKIVFSEKLLRPNTLSVFSGDILVTPKIAGKENAVKYILETNAKNTERKLDAYVFGDASVDVPMLSLKENSLLYFANCYLVHPAPLAKKVIQQAAKTNPNMHIINNDGPQAILSILDSTYHLKPKFSAAQNTKARKLIVYAEPLLNRLVDTKLTPNEVSLLGLKKLIRGIRKIYDGNPNAWDKITGVGNFAYGTFIDMLDGIRARQNGIKTPEGQLIDGFCDRAKEFYQLFVRAQKKFETDEQKGYSTLLTAIATCLPSIARAQAEITGAAVPEQDSKGGSMLGRTKNLSISLIYDIFGNKDKSYKYDQDVYSASLATFQHRLTYITKGHPELVSGSRTFNNPQFLRMIKISTFSTFQKEALERWLFYTEILQEENEMVEFYLRQYPQLLKEYKKFQKQISFYLKLDIAKYRKLWRFTDYKLSLKKFF